LIYAPEISKPLTTSQSPDIDARNNGDCPRLSHKLISAPELSKYLTTSEDGGYAVARCLLSSEINLRDKRWQSPLSIASEYGRCDFFECLFSSRADINLYDARNNGDCPRLSHKLISAPELSKYLTTSQCPAIDARNNGDCPCSLHTLISAPELSKHSTTSICPWFDAIVNGDPAPMSWRKHVYYYLDVAVTR
jgi:hypothetical protein